MPVYFIQAGDDGPIKIGWAESVARRRSQLQVQTYLKLSVRAMIDGDQGVEKRLHDRFKRHLIRGEWFKPCILDGVVDADAANRRHYMSGITYEEQAWCIPFS